MAPIVATVSELSSFSTKVETTAGILESAVRVSSQSSNVAAQTTTETSTQQAVSTEPSSNYGTTPSNRLQTTSTTTPISISILTASRIEPRTPEEPLVHTSVLPDSPSLLPIPEDVVIANPSTQESSIQDVASSASLPDLIPIQSSDSQDTLLIVTPNVISNAQPPSSSSVIIASRVVQSASLTRTMFVPGVENNVPVPSAAQNVSQQLNTSNSNSVVTPVASGLGALLIVVGIIGAVIYRRKSGLKIMKANSDTVSIRNTCNSNIFLGNSLRVASPEPEPHRDSGFFHPFTIDERQHHNNLTTDSPSIETKRGLPPSRPANANRRSEETAPMTVGSHDTNQKLTKYNSIYSVTWTMSDGASSFVSVEEEDGDNNSVFASSTQGSI